MLHFKEYGQGEPVLILHGLFGTADNWQTVANQLATQFTVFAVDLRNHGRSFHSDDTFNYDVLADDIQDFMDKHWLYQTRLIGHSMGGKVAMQVALNDPDRIQKLAIIDIAPRAYRGGHENIFQALNALDLNALKNRPQAETFLMQQLENDVPTVQFLLKNLSRRPSSEGGGFEWKMNLSVLERDYDNILKPIEATEPFENPTLFVRGGLSRYIKDEDTVEMLKLFPKMRLETIPNAGHWVHANQPELLIKSLFTFLMRNEG
jgi:esterase